MVVGHSVILDPNRLVGCALRLGIEEPNEQSVGWGHGLKRAGLGSTLPRPALPGVSAAHQRKDAPAEVLTGVLHVACGSCGEFGPHIGGQLVIGFWSSQQRRLNHCAA